MESLSTRCRRRKPPDVFYTLLDMSSGFGPPDEEIPLMYPAGSQQHPHWQNWPYATPSSMRNVDAECAARPLLGGYGEQALT